MVSTISRPQVLKPTTFSDFRRIGKRKMGRSPADAKAIHDERQENRTAPARPSLMRFIVGRRWIMDRPHNVAGIPLGSHSGKTIDRINDARKKNWVADGFTCDRSYLRVIDCGRYKGSWSGKTVYNYSRTVESWGAVVSPSRLYYRIETATGVRSKIAKAPKGWSWNLDDNGIRIVNATGVDYHPTASDLLTMSPAEIAGKARDNNRIRKSAKRQADAEIREAKRTAAQEADIIRRAEAEGCMVCLADSVRAGNCSAGSVNWGQRHGLAVGRHYKPTELLAMGNGESRRVALAVASAMRRHRVEMDRGYCIVADHR